MTLSDISIRRPVFAWMLMVGLLVFGGISFSRMGISQLPDVDFPVVNVAISWVGASPETIELAVTDVLEDAIMSVEGVRSVSSRCQEGSSNTSIEFDLNRNIDVALQEVQTKIAQAQKNLPEDIDPPVVTKTNPEDQPILWAALSGGQDLRQKVIFARDRLKDQITTIPGVGDVRLGGYVDPNMRVWLNTDAMKTRQIAVDDVSAALRAGSTIVPTGYLESGDKETNLRIVSEASSPSDFKNLIISNRGGAPIWSQIRLGDVARVEEGLADIRRISRINLLPAVGFGVIKQRGSNAVAVGNGVKERVRYIKTMLPKGMDIHIVNDSTRFIEDSTHELLFTLTLSAILTSIVCWLFLGTLSSAFNVVLSIPVSLVGSFIVLRACGFTINTFTLLALSLSIGIVVDDAIMVLENIVRYFEQGMGRVKASLVGAREITGAAVAATIAILAIFLPVIFMDGIIGKFFFQFGVTMSVAVTISLLEALTLAPMRCSQFLKPASHGNKITAAVDRFMNRLMDQYRGLLDSALHHRWKVIGIAVGMFAVSLLLLKGMKQEFVPSQDQSRFMLAVQTPMGSSLDFTDSVFKQMEARLLQRPEIDNVYVAVGGFQGGLVNQGNLFIMLKDQGKRGVHEPFKKEPSQIDFMAWTRTAFKDIQGLKRVSVIDLSLSGFSSSRGFPIQFQVQGPDWGKLSETALTMMEKLRTSGLAQDVDSDYNPNMPEAQILPDHAKAEARGVTITNIASTISALVGSLRVGKYTDESGHRNDVRLKLQDQYNQSPKDIKRIWVRNNHGEMVPISDVVSIKDGSSLLTISRYNRERSITIQANVPAGKNQAESMQYVEAMAKEVLPANYHITFTGSSQAFQESFGSLIIALILGILVAYMVLGAQFNSFIHPFTVLLALPFSVIGAFIALRISGISLNIYSMIGMLLLMGIVKKNSILLVDFTNQRRREGADVSGALLEACPLRLRPILMTSIATVAAAIPAAIAFGPGAENVRPMAVVVIGGVLTSTLLTLLVVPCAYSLLSALERPKHQIELEKALLELGEKV